MEVLMTISIRQETPSDYRRVEEITREAFWNLYFPGCSEHYVVHHMRQDEAFLAELSFVIEKEGEIVGSIFYTRSQIIGQDQTLDTISFGPVSIKPGLHRQGLGKQLIEYSIEKAKSLGHKVIVTLGYPYHYEPYGFKSGKHYNVSMADGKYYKGLLVLPLEEHALEGISGYASFADVLDDVDKDDLEKFDLQFPKKEKAYKPSQKEFAEASGQLDE